MPPRSNSRERINIHWPYICGWKLCAPFFGSFFALLYFFLLLGHQVVHANHALARNDFFAHFLFTPFVLGCVLQNTRFIHFNEINKQTDKHVKCSKYSNLSGEILFLSAFVYVITLDMKCLNCSFQPCGLLFFFIHFSSFFLSFFSFYCKYIISTRKREKNYGKFPLNKTYNPNNFCARAKYARIYITKRLNADGWMDGEIIHLQKFNGLCMVWRIVRKMPHE